MLVNQVSDKVPVAGGIAQDVAAGTNSAVGAVDVMQTATDVVAEYVKMTGAGRARRTWPPVAGGPGGLLLRAERAL